MKQQIKAFYPYVSERSKKYVEQILSGTQLAEGPVTSAFETAFSKRYGIEALAVNSGTSGFELVYDILNIQKGDEVIVPVLGHPANALPVLRRGGKVVFSDIAGTFTMDPEDVRRKITEKTKAIVFVHFGGSSAHLNEIRTIAAEKCIPLIEDAAHSLPGNSYGQGDFVVFSLQAIKFLTSGDGGMVYCKRPSHREKLRKLRWFGFDRELPNDQRDIEEPGYKMHMNDIMAGIGLGNIETLDEPLRERQRVASQYHDSGLPVLVYPWLTILVNKDAEEIRQHLADNDIESGKFHLRLDKYAVFKCTAVFPNMDELEKQYLLLPAHHMVKRQHVDEIIKHIKEVIGNDPVEIPKIGKVEIVCKACAEHGEVRPGSAHKPYAPNCRVRI